MKFTTIQCPDCSDFMDYEKVNRGCKLYSTCGQTYDVTESGVSANRITLYPNETHVFKYPPVLFSEWLIGEIRYRRMLIYARFIAGFIDEAEWDADLRVLRKNHAAILDGWQRFRRSMPPIWKFWAAKPDPNDYWPGQEVETIMQQRSS